MKRLIVRHKDFILRVHASENNTTILDSHQVKRPSDMKSLLYSIKTGLPDTYAINRRGIFGMINEWRVHNLLYSLGMFKDRTKDVDLDTDQPWYMSVLYFILSPFYLHFK